jgi:hypothetical protein
MADPQEKVRVQLPDGRIGSIPRANLDAARSRGAKVLDAGPAGPMQAGMAGGGEEQPGLMESALNTTGKVLGAIGDTMDPTPVLKAITSGDPVKEVGKLGTGILDAQADQLHKAREAWGKGNHLDAVRYAMGYVIPMLGPAVNAAGDDMQQGRYAEGVGKTVGLGLQLATPAKMQQKGGINVRPVLKSQLNPAEAAAIAFADENGIPVDLAMRTGNKAVGNVKTIVQNTIPGAAVSKKAHGAQSAALAGKGGQMADAVHPFPVSPQQAGEGVRGGLEAEVLRHNTEAASNYDTLRQFEADPANARQVPVSTGRTPQGEADLNAFSVELAGRPFAKLQPHEQSAVLRTAKAAGVDVAERPILEEVALPVDLRTAKAELAPVVQRLQRGMPIAQQRASTGMKALTNILEAPDFLPTSVADSDLGAIKAAARGADLPELRTLSQGLAANAVQKMEDAVADGVGAAGPEASAARNAGRAATAAKYDTAAVLRQLREEPVQAFQQLTYAGDSGIQFLKDVYKQTPNEMPKVGRSYLQGLLETAAQSGEFRGGKQLLNEWQKLGPETKKVLFRNPMMIQDMDNFFRLAEMQSRNPNPSGTAHVLSMTGHAGSATGLLLTNPAGAAAVALAPYVVAKMLYSPKAARALMNGMRVPLANKPAASMAFTNIMAIAEKLQKEEAGEAGKEK